jgi:Tfp pilus assembly protein PilF
MRALELDPRLADAHATLGLIAMFSFQWVEAEAAYRKAIELNPKYPTVHHWYALLLGWQGGIPEAYAETDRAHRLDPTSPILKSSRRDHPPLRARFRRSYRSVQKNPRDGAQL